MNFFWKALHNTLIIALVLALSASNLSWAMDSWELSEMQRATRKDATETALNPLATPPSMHMLQTAVEQKAATREGTGSLEREHAQKRESAHRESRQKESEPIGTATNWRRFLDNPHLCRPWCKPENKNCLGVCCCYDDPACSKKWLKQDAALSAQEKNLVGITACAASVCCSAGTLLGLSATPAAPASVVATGAQLCCASGANIACCAAGMRCTHCIQNHLEVFRKNTDKNTHDHKKEPQKNWCDKEEDGLCACASCGLAGMYCSDALGMQIPCAFFPDACCALACCALCRAGCLDYQKKHSLQSSTPPAEIKMTV